MLRTHFLCIYLYIFVVVIYGIIFDHPPFVAMVVSECVCFSLLLLYLCIYVDILLLIFSRRSFGNHFRLGSEHHSRCVLSFLFLSVIFWQKIFTLSSFFCFSLLGVLCLNRDVVRV